MEIRRELSIELLSEMLNTCNQTQLFAEYKLRYLTPHSPDSIKQIEEFQNTKHRAEVKINKIESCIAWLNELQSVTAKP